MGYYNDLKKFGGLKSGGNVEDPRYAPFEQQKESAGYYNELKQKVQKERQKADDQGVDMDTGGDFWDRVMTGIKITPQGKAGYLEDKYGQGNVRMSGEGNFEVLPKESSRWIRFDERGMTAADLADFSGDVVETIPTVAAGGLTKSPAGAALGALGGNVLRQGLSEMIPGDEGLGIGERATHGLMSMLLGAGAQYGSNKLIDLFDKGRPHNLVQPLMVNRGNERTLMTGKNLMEKTGVDLRDDQLTGNATAQMLVGLMRRHPSTANMVKQQEVKQLGQLRSYFDNTLNEISSGKIGKEKSALKATAAYEGYVKKLSDTMSRVGGQMFSEVWELAERLPDKRIMKIDNTISEWKKIIEDFDTPLGSDTASQVVNYGKNIVKTLEANGSRLNPHQFQRSLSIYSNASKGTGNIIKDVSDRSVQRAIATRLSRALRQDLDQTVDEFSGRYVPEQLANAGSFEGQIASKLKAARDYYRGAAQEIDEVSESVLSATVGQPGEDTVKRLLNSWAPSEVRESMTMMQRISPDAAASLKKAALQEILDRSKPSGSATVVGGANFSPAKLITNANKSDKHIRAMFSATGDMPGYVSWRRGIKVAERIADHAGTDGSPTAPLQWTMSLVKSFTGHVWPLDPKGMAMDLASVLAPQKMQKALLTNQGRHALYEVTKTGNSVRNVMAGMAYLKAIDERDDITMPKKEVSDDGGFVSSAAQ